MSPNRYRLLAVTCSLSCSLVACGDVKGSSDPEAGNDAGIGATTPDAASGSGAHQHYVVNKIDVPTSTSGLDLGSSSSSMLDGTIDNQLGELLSTFNSVLPLQSTFDAAVNKGNIILLVDFQTPDFTTASAAGLTIKLGADPMPAPCASVNDTTCGHHLQGTGTFTIAGSSPPDAPLVGAVSAGVFASDAGNLPFAFALDTTTVVNLSLVHARVKATGLSAAGLSATIGGLVTMTDVQNVLAPAIATSLDDTLRSEGCVIGSDPNANCDCTSNAASALLAQFDANRDCNITGAEVQASSVIRSFFMPDSCSMATCTMPDSVSLGINVTAVPATF